MLQRAWRYRGEYLLARAGLGLFTRLPLSASIRLAHRLADAAFLIDRRRRATAVDNILRAGLANGLAPARGLARRSFRHFAAVLAEAVYVNFSKAEDVVSGWDIEWRLPPASRVLLDDPEQSMILACGHLGNWEIGARVLARRKPVTAVARHLNNPYLHAYLQQRNHRRRINQIPKYGHNPLRLLEMLGKGEVLALMIDQHARHQSAWVDFFGRPAASHTAVALLPLISKIPLCFGSCIRTGARQFRMAVSEPLSVVRSGDRGADVRRVLSDLNGRLEQAIRLCPEQYLWAHRRWRDPPPRNDKP